MKTQKDLAALILRVGFGFFIAFGHGLGKLQMLISGNIQFPALFGISPTINLVLAVLAEFVAGIMVLIGLRTRLASIPLMITMLTAALVVHSGDPLFSAGGASKEFALLYFIAFAVTFLLGSGKYSVDAIAGKRY
ncbi:DoxX family protein [Marinilabilia sp.]|uniref:DoxX family protein n=1 Tax=Marinilabilia sp. TaxID=2021252 RepID=UPI0025BB7E65|nr:DoxX family protein [Marinilabilia sp.]